MSHLRRSAQERRDSLRGGAYGRSLALERAEAFRGRYHVLGGALCALDGVGPEDLNIASLLERARNPELREIILATNATVDGQTTAHYLAEKLSGMATVSRLARGVPIGSELDYMDDGTLADALRQRRPFLNSRRAFLETSALKERGQRFSERFGDFRDRIQSGVEIAAFYSADMRLRDACAHGELLLRYAFFYSDAADVFAEKFLRVHRRQETLLRGDIPYTAIYILFKFIFTERNFPSRQ